MANSKNTIAKSKIVELIEASSAALSHNDIQEKLDGLCDRVTIYRVLDRLVEEAVVHKVIDVNGVARYAPCHQRCEGDKHSHDHVHFMCTNCKELTCLDIVPEYKLPRRYKVNSINFVISGLCPDCS